MKKSNLHWYLLAVLVFASLIFAAATGRLTPHHVEDTPSYLHYPFDSLSLALNSIRTPGYPLVLRVIESTLGLSAVPAFQWIVACVAAWWFAVELGRWKASRITMWVSAFAIVFSCTSLDHQSTLSTDALAASIGVLTVALVLRWIRGGRRHVDAAWIIATAMTAIMLRPAYLPIIVWVGWMGTVLLPPSIDSSCDGSSDGSIDGSSGDRNSGGTKLLLRARFFSSMLVMGCCLVLVFGWMAMRWRVVNDFGLLPFGHQNLAGLSLQMVSDDELKEIASQDPDPMMLKLVAKTLEQRAIASDEKRTLAMTNFQPGPGLSTMTMEGQWNDLIYQTVVPASIHLYPDDPVARHHAIGRLNRLVIERYPGRYFRWLLLASRRAVWGVAADILMNPIFLCFWSGVGFYWIGRIVVRQPWRADIRNDPHKRNTQSTVFQSPAIALLSVIAVSYAVVMVGFVVLTSPPLGRFADAAAIFIPCWLIAGVSEAVASQLEKLP